MPRFRKLSDTVDYLQQVMSVKGNQYGPTYRKVALALSCPVQHSISVRMLEKLLRIDNLLKLPAVDMAHIREEFLDIAVYACLGAFESEPEYKPEVEISK